MKAILSAQVGSVFAPLGKFFGNPNKGLNMRATIKVAERAAGLQSMPTVKQDPKTLLGDRQLRMINKFIDEDLIAFQYGSAGISKLAVPGVEYLPGLYHRLEKAEYDRELKLENPMVHFKLRPQAADWGGYTMNPDTMRTSFASLAPEVFSVVGLDAKGGKNFGKKLVYVTEEMVRKNNPTHLIPDIRYALYLKINPEKAPAVMKNGKANIFAGTTIMIASNPYVIAQTFRADGKVRTELVPLSLKLEDTAQVIPFTDSICLSNAD